MWNNLVNWVEQNGCYCHKSLELRNVNPSRDADTVMHRGLFLSRASASIARDEILIRLPRAAATISGQYMPSTYVERGNSEKATVAVSPWLRCIAALMLAMDQCDEKKGWSEIDVQPNLQTTEERDFSPYILSLPISYETIWRWSENEIEEYLAGTKPAGLDGCHSTPSSNAWMIDHLVVRNRYETSILPYLRHCGVIPEGLKDLEDDSRAATYLDRFKVACQIVSTRGFFMDHFPQPNSMKIVHEKDLADIYRGPYLLPVIDMINHADHSSVGINAKLELLHQEDAFVIRATDNISPDTEILHSYGDPISSHQFLLSFGFVPWNRVQLAISLNHSVESFEGSIVISKQEVWDSCWYVIETGLPFKLATIIEQSCLEDETWEVVVDRSRTASSVPNDIEIHMSLVVDNGAIKYSPESLLCDELVTAACVPFLPSCAYAEIAIGSFLDHTVLQDYFLGQLVGAALIRTIQQRLLSYKLIPFSTVQQLLPISKNSVESVVLTDDISLLKTIETFLSSNDNSSSFTYNHDVYRLAYGLTIRIEEKTTLEALLKLVSFELDNLDGEDGSNLVRFIFDDDKHSKRLKSTMD
jgi:SET domain